MDKAVYIGSGLDIIPIIILSNINEFIYIDSQPTSEYGSYLYGNKNFYRTNFIPNLEKILDNNNFILTQKKENYLEYTNGIKIIKYFINTSFPEMINDDIMMEIKQCHNLILSGYDPNKIILQFMPYLKNIYCNCHTVYNIPDCEYEDEESINNSVFRELIMNFNNYNYFLIKEKFKYEYWNYNIINKTIIDKFEICNYKSLLKLYNYAKDTFTNYYLEKID